VPYKIPGLGYEVETSMVQQRTNRFCPYKNDTCIFCEASVVFVKAENSFEEDEPVCAYPKIGHIEHILTNCNPSSIITKTMMAMDNFCPIEMLEGFGNDGPEGRIEPEVILLFMKNNISDIFHYLKWYCDGKYTEKEWRELQARILTMKLQEE
jgi:hypothetical protein